MSFDARTLLVVGGILSWILAATIEFQAVRPDRDRLMPDSWTLALLAKGLGLNLLSQRGLISDFWSISLANSLLLVGPLFCYAALQRVRGVATNYFLIAAVPVSVGILLPLIGFAPEHFPARTAVFTVAALFGFSLNCWSAIQLGRAGFTAGASLLLGTSVVLAAIAVAHALAVVGGGVPGLFGGHGIQLTLYTINDACIALSTFGYMDILRTVRDRQSRIDPDLLPDPLTGLYSRKAFIRSGQAELARAQLRGNPVTVMMVQIDGFDALGASQGRAFADQQLRRIAAGIQSDIRNFDLAGRLAAKHDRRPDARITPCRGRSGCGPHPHVRGRRNHDAQWEPHSHHREHRVVRGRPGARRPGVGNGAGLGLPSSCPSRRRRPGRHAGLDTSEGISRGRSLTAARFKDFP